MKYELFEIWNCRQREKERGLLLRASCPFWHRSEVKIETREKANSWRWGVLYTEPPPLYPTINLKQSFELWGVEQTGGYIVSWFPCRRGHGDPASFKLVFLEKLGLTFNSISASNDGIFFLYFFFPFSPPLLPLGISRADQTPATKMSPPSLGALKLSFLKVQEE